MTKYYVGTGGWAYFDIPHKPQLEMYARIFNHVEVNSTFYQMPQVERVKRWRSVVPNNFTFSVRCHHELTHSIGLRPVDSAYHVFHQMIHICQLLKAPILLLETPKSYLLTEAKLADANTFFSTVELQGIKLAWEIRSPITRNVITLLQDFNIVHCVDLSRDIPAIKAPIVYSRLFGKGYHNIYQFTDKELIEIDQKINRLNPNQVFLSYHGMKMTTDAGRFLTYKKTGVFPAVTPFVGIDSARAVLSEDAQFPSSKIELVKDQGWKLIDLTPQQRIHLSEFLSILPERLYHNVDEVIDALEVCA